MLAGEFAQQLDTQGGDFPLRRADDIFADQLAVVVDDALMGVTDVLRGRDLLSSTPRQIALFEALGFPVPRFWHVPLMLDETGRRMSKRDGSDSIQMLRGQGESPEKIVGRLAESVGLAAPNERVSARDLLGRLSLDTFRSALNSTD
jgi:glutamyl-tRNA synthetase